MTTGETTTGTPARDPLAVLGEIRERENAATKGPWRLETSHGTFPYAIHLGAPHVERPGGKELRDDRRYTNLCEMRLEDAEFTCSARSDITCLLEMLEAALKPHTPFTVYRNADDCGHECPPEPDWRNQPPEGTAERAAFEAAAGAWDAYHEEHTTGSGPDGSSGDVTICMLSPDYEACPACSALVYETWGDDDRFVKASECTVRPAVVAAAIAAALSGEEVPRPGDIPPQPSFSHHVYGVDLDWFGEDGGMAARGHIPDLRFVAACNHLARTQAGLVNVMDEPSLRDALSIVSRVWAVPGSLHSAEYEWSVKFDRSITSETPGAIPMTVMLP